MNKAKLTGILFCAAAVCFVFSAVTYFFGENGSVSAGIIQLILSAGMLALGIVWLRQARRNEQSEKEEKNE